MRERTRAAERWEDAVAGQRQALLVAGEPGIGKTRFTIQVALELHAAGAVVLFGHCAEELGAPYGAFIEALTHLVEHAPDEALAAHVERHGGELSRLVPALLRRVPAAPAPVETDPETERYLLFAAVVGLLAEASAELPLVILLDDLHWADAPTLALLKHVVAEAHGARILVLATYRDTDLARGHELTDVLADLRREEGIERLALKGSTRRRSWRSWRRWPGTSSTPPASRSPTRSPPRPTATRSSWASCCAISWSRARCRRRPTDAGT